jgi:hypothetical protein
VKVRTQAEKLAENEAKKAIKAAKEERKEVFHCGTAIKKHF